MEKQGLLRIVKAKEKKGNEKDEHTDLFLTVASLPAQPSMVVKLGLAFTLHSFNALVFQSHNIVQLIWCQFNKEIKHQKRTCLVV